MSETGKFGYILRIKNDEYRDQTFELKKYYTGMMRDYRRGQTILFMKKVKVDSFIGFGIIDRVEMLWEMTPEEENYCRENKWRVGITFNPLVRFEHPLPKKISILKDDPRKGYFLHGARLTDDQVDTILEQAEEYSPEGS